MRAVCSSLLLAATSACGLEANQEPMRLEVEQVVEDTSAATVPELHGVKIGSDLSTLQVLGAPVATDHLGDLIARRWNIPDGNSLSASSNAAGVVFVELDWSGHALGAAAPYDGMTFGLTTLADIRRQMGSNGVAFAGRDPVTLMGPMLVNLNSYEMSGVWVTFVTTIDSSQVQTPEHADRATLDAILLTAPAYAETMWGQEISDPQYVPARWRSN